MVMSIILINNAKQRNVKQLFFILPSTEFTSLYCHVVWSRLKREALTIFGDSYINIVSNGYFTFFLEELYRFIEHRTTRCTYIIIRSSFSLAWLFTDATISKSEVTFRNTSLSISCQINTRFSYKLYSIKRSSKTS